MLEQPAERPVPYPSPRAWALATAAVLTERNGQRHDLLGGMERCEANVNQQKQLLRDWWGVTDKATLLDALRWIEDRGHRKAFDDLGVRLETLKPEEVDQLRARMRDDLQGLQQVDVVLEHRRRLGEKSILGWDYGRYVTLCRWGYLVGYLTEDEAWERIMPAARLLQKAFDSWADLGENYLVGREFWSYEETRRTGGLYREAMQRLLREPASPWNRCAWDLDLSREKADDGG